MALHFARRGRLPLALLPGVLPIPLGKAGRRATIAAGGASPAGCSNGEARGSGATATPGPMEPHPSPPSLRGSPPRRPQETRACAFRGRLIRWLVTSKRTLRGSYGKERWGAEKAVPYARLSASLLESPNCCTTCITENAISGSAKGERRSRRDGFEPSRLRVRASA
jgi:hypothetical protein